MQTSRIAVLGPVLVAAPDGTLQPVPGALARSFLVALVLARGHALSTGALIDELWADEPPRGARAALQTLVSRLRRGSADGLVVSTGTGYALGIDPTDIDLVAAERTDPTSDDVPAVLEQWRGSPGDDVDGHLGEVLAERAASTRRTLRRALGDVLLARGDTEEAIALWQEECADDPLDEVAVGGAMRALAAAGRTNEALAVFARHRDRLVEELGADPSGDLVRLNAELLRRSSDTSGAVRRIGLRAAPTPLVGRDDAVAEVAGLLGTARLVTILGAGGLGKTRLAQTVAADVPADTAVVVLELAPLTAGEDVLPALGALLGVAELRAGRSLRTAVVADLRSRVVAALDEQPTVLVLDNCEHIVDDVAALTAGLLERLPDLRVLTTSRAPLAIAGEVVAPLGPLPVEADGAAVRLFTERARAARPGAVLPVDAVRRICTRLDGSPLAIELAAARIRGMSVDEIERRLDDRFALLRGGDRSAPERHRTLLAVIEWSWRLLDEGARDLLTRLALFPDGLAVDAVESVADDARRADALDDLAELVEQSLVQLVETEGEPARYRLLETVREFGAARLSERGTTDDVRAAMLRWGTAFARGRDLFVIGGDRQVQVFGEVRRESDNLVTLLRWALQGGDRSAVTQVFAVLAAYWSLRGAHGEVIALAPDVVTVLRAAPPADGDRQSAAIALVIAGASSLFDDRRTGARAISALRRLTRAGSTGDAVLDAQSALLLVVGRRDDAAALLARWREASDPRLVCFACTLSAPLAENAGDLDLALGYARRAETIAATIDDAWTFGTAATSMTQLLAQVDRPAEALRAAEAARARLERFNAEDDLFELATTTALAAAALGDADRARAVADEVGGRTSATRGFDVEGVQMAVLVHAIRAEAARADGLPGSAAEEYVRAWDVAVANRRAAQQWVMLGGAARIASGIEAEAAAADDAAAAAAAAAPAAPDRAAAGETAPAAAGDTVQVGDRRPGAVPPGGREGSGRPVPGLQAVRDHVSDATAAVWQDTAHRSRVAALVALRMGVWLDMPVLGVVCAGLALHGAVVGLDVDLVARLWAFAVRLGSRQDFPVLRRVGLEAVIAQHTGAAVLRDAVTASSGLDRAEAVTVVRTVLEDRALRRTGAAQAFRM